MSAEKQPKGRPEPLKWLSDKPLPFLAHHLAPRHQVSLRPIRDRIIVEVVVNGARKQGGLVLPDSITTDPREGRIVGIGSGRREGEKRIDLEISVGNHVLFRESAGTEVVFGEGEYVILRADEVLGILG